jgi:hypothetical protein
LKRYIKYGLFIIAAIAIVAIIFYILKKPTESVIKNIPADVSYCFTIDKKQFFVESFLAEDTKKDSLFKKIKNKIPEEVFLICNTIGINSLGDLAVFGETNDEINAAWIGENEEKLREIIKQKHWPEKRFKKFSQVKISDKLYLNYKWPIVILSTNQVSESFEFFNPTLKKLSDKDLKNSKTDQCLIYGFVIPNRSLLINYPFLPLYGRAYFGIKKEDKKVEVFFIQPRMKLRGKLGIPKKIPQSMALLSWPIDSGSIPHIKQIPSVVLEEINKIVTKPLSHLYAEVLDTVSTYQEIIQYDMDSEFHLTQKIINHYKTYPGLRLEFLKTMPDTSNVISSQAKPTNLGLDIFKLYHWENKNSYFIASENKLPEVSSQKIPDYYIYANLETLKTDPFWESIIKTSFKSLQLHAEKLGKGSVFVLTLKR